MFSRNELGIYTQPKLFAGPFTFLPVLRSTGQSFSFKWPSRKIKCRWLTLFTFSSKCSHVWKVLTSTLNAGYNLIVFIMRGKIASNAVGGNKNNLWHYGWLLYVPRQIKQRGRSHKVSHGIPIRWQAHGKNYNCFSGSEWGPIHLKDIYIYICIYI